MENIFLAYNDRAMTSGILHKNPDLAKDLKAATEAFIQLAKKTHSDEHDDISESEAEEVPRRPVGTYEQDVATLLGLNNTSNTINSSPEPVATGQGLGPMDLGYIFDNSSNTPSGANTNSMATPIYSSTTQPAATMSMDFSNFSYSTAGANTNPLAIAPAASTLAGMSKQVIPISAVDKTDMLRIRSLTPPYTYSFEETTFARRLQRAALERGFHLITNAEIRPSVFLRVFRLSLLYHNRDTLLVKFRRALARNTEEPLETYQTPFIHLGGAGLHYNTGRVRNGYIVKPGPLQRRAILESTESPGAMVDIDFDLSDYEGEWFDSNDVEGYLNEKGLFINPQSSFAEGQISLSNSVGVATFLANSSPPANIFDSPQATTADIDMSSLTAAGSTATPPTPNMSEQALELGMQRLFPELGAASPNTLWNNAAADWLMGSGNKTPDFLESGWSGYNKFSGWDMLDSVGMVDSFAPSNVVTAEQTVQKQVTVDVSRFIDGESPAPKVGCAHTDSDTELIKTAICLGRAPGFRKKDVDRALSASIIQVM